MTRYEIELNVWLGLGGWFWNDNYGCGHGTYETRGQAIDALIEYLKAND